MTTPTHSRNNPELHSVVYRGGDENCATELGRLADLIGLDFITARPGTPAEGVLQFASAGLPPMTVEASFHELFAPYFASGKVRLHVRDDAADILELMSAVGSTLRGRIIAVVGAHGGAGTSTIAAWLARVLTNKNESVALVDLDPNSAGIDVRLNIADEPGCRWADLGGHGALLPGKLNSALATWRSIQVLSADARAAVPLPSADRDDGTRVIAALSQVHSWTILDCGILNPKVRSWLEWSDAILLVTLPDAASLATTRVKRELLPRAVPEIVVVRSVSSKNQAAHIADMLDLAQILPVRHLRGMDEDLNHGLSPGDRPRSGTGRDIQALAEHMKQVIR
ncbi:MAG: hypothetical protein GX483_08875 [Actinomycetaceae bacterium]|nr:hypothetical protein [Actinomycetaceae bacterium]